MKSNYLDPIRFALLALICLPAASSGQLEGPIDPAAYDLRPLLRLQAIGADFIGQPFEVDVTVDRGGPTLYVYTAATGNARRVTRAVGSSEALSALNRELARVHVARQTAPRCGQPAPDYVARYTLTWYGTNGRVKTLQIGGNYEDCPEDFQAVFDAACAYLWATAWPALEYCAEPLSPE